MIECTKCKKRLGFWGSRKAFWDSHIIGNEYYCDSCWNKTTSKERDKKEIQQEPRYRKIEKVKEENKFEWWWLILVGLAIWWIFSSLDNSNKIDEYKSCVDDCVSDNDYCLSSAIVFSQSLSGWISEDGFEDCSLDLESCVSDCKG